MGVRDGRRPEWEETRVGVRDGRRPVIRGSKKKGGGGGGGGLE